MPYKKIKNRYAYRKGYYAGYRKATLDHLGKKCVNCGSTENLEIDHIKELLRKSRTIKDLKNISELQVLCKSCNLSKKEKVIRNDRKDAKTDTI